MTGRLIRLICRTPNERLDRFLAAAIPELSRTQTKRLIQSGQVQIDGLEPKPNTILSEGTTITVMLPEVEAVALQPQEIPLQILFEDAFLIAVNKPAGLVVHPAAGNRRNTLVNALLYRYPDLAVLDPERPGIVHRLDKDTSGVIVIARTEAALESLQAQFKSGKAQKTYLALVHGHPQAGAGLIDVPIGRHPRQRQKMAPLPDGKPARTRYKVINTFTKTSLLELHPETGRTHQIRVHLAWLGHAVVGDTVYGPRSKNPLIKRQFLHASQLSIRHPQQGHPLTFDAPLPEDLQAVLEQLT
jgi:23S rRNA pseudouridine1911/1915/1917 synthase